MRRQITEYLIKMSQMVTLLAFVFLAEGAMANVPEPDNIYWGSVSIGGQTASADSGVVVTLVIEGEVIASYTMGENLAAGDAYALHVPIDGEVPQAPQTAAPGDTAIIKIAEVEAATVQIGEMGTTTELNLSIDALDCVSSQSGSLLTSSTFGDVGACTQSSNHFTIASGHTVTWDGSNGPLSGNITIQEGGVFRIIGDGGTITGQIILQGGTFDVDANVTVSTLSQVLDSTIDLADGVMLTVLSDVTVPATKTLALLGTGSLKMNGTLTLLGSLNAGTSTIDIRGQSLVLNDDLNLANATLLTDAQSQLLLNSDLALTTGHAVTFNVDLNAHTLTLNSDTTDLTVASALVVDSANEGIVSQGADVVFLGFVTMSDGSLSSSSGTLNFQNGAALSGGELSIPGTELITSSSFSNTGASVVSDAGTLSRPVADAGHSQTVNRGVEVTLNGSNSFDVDGSITEFLWTQISGPEATLVNADSVQATFVAPAVSLSGGTLTFRLLVTDNGGATGEDEVSIDVLSTGGIALTVNKNGGGAGIITSVPEGILCGSSCDEQTHSFGAGTTITLIAEAGANDVFMGWSGVCDGQRGHCEVTLEEAQTITATFNTATLLTQAMLDSGSILVGSSPYRANANLTVSEASPVVLDPGVHVFFDEDIVLTVEGRMSLQGSESSPIVFTASDVNAPWGGLRVTDAHQGIDDWSYFEISYANQGVLFDGIGSATGSMTISNASFRHNQTGVGGEANYLVAIDSSSFFYNTTGVSGGNKSIESSEFFYNTHGTANLSTTDIQNSIFRYNDVGLSGDAINVSFSFIANNSNRGIEVVPGALEISQNTIRDNGTGIHILPTVPGTTSGFSIVNNNIYGNTQYNLHNEHLEDVTAINNWWNLDQEAAIISTLLDGRSDDSLGVVTVSPFLDDSVGTVPLEGQKGDVDGDNRFTGGDVTRLRYCVAYQIFLSFQTEEEVIANFAGPVGLDFARDCTRMVDQDGDGRFTGGDVTRLRYCIAYQIFLSFQSEEEVIANFAGPVGLVFDRDCAIVTESW